MRILITGWLAFSFDSYNIDSGTCCNRMLCHLEGSATLSSSGR